MTRWQIVIVNERRCELVVTAAEMREWNPALAALAGDDDETLAGAWGDTLRVDWDDCSVSNPARPGSFGAEFGIDESSWTVELVDE